mgnify:CR=1 FL=1
MGRGRIIKAEGLVLGGSTAINVAAVLGLAPLTGIPLPFVSISVNYFGGAIHKGFERIQAQLSDVSPRNGKMFQNEPPANRMISRIANRKPGMA